MSNLLDLGVYRGLVHVRIFKRAEGESAESEMHRVDHEIDRLGRGLPPPKQNSASGHQAGKHHHTKI